ncbi:MAG: Holliday junction resolvase Hjc [Asgard group archaeon]|nr:Holliday junction resolvase Hjc [Asgard group archaeon]
MSPKGIRAERDLVHQFWEAGFAVLRSPASGGGTTLPRPDLIVGSKKRNRYFVIEIKTIRRETLYINFEQIDGLIEFANRIGFQPLLGIKFKYQRKGFLFLKVPEQLQDVRNSKNYRVTYAHACTVGKSFGEIIGEFEQKKLVQE